MIREIGYCQGIENYSRHFDGRTPGQPPFTLLDYFPDDFLIVMDESHQTIPQIRGQLGGDRSRKDSLVEHGFRLPSAYDNRPLSFDEFEARINQVIYTSATPGEYEKRAVRPDRRADHPPHRPGGPRDRHPAHQGPDRRPASARSRRASRVTSACW